MAKGNSTRKPMTPDERRARAAERLREARARDPWRFAEYRRRYILKKAERLRAEAEAAEGGEFNA